MHPGRQNGDNVIGEVLDFDSPSGPSIIPYQVSYADRPMHYEIHGPMHRLCLCLSGHMILSRRTVISTEFRALHSSTESTTQITFISHSILLSFDPYFDVPRTETHLNLFP